ncbi:putative testis-expressed protein 13C [Camelus dromedarius]|uniref:Putative testis-expressed protein 13C n=1 Tax=Camelus dromedarius TaxID=9838 RepID=A0A5N4C0V2_CAMDR|nr:testis-expressed protein 13D-like [Camelus dromedarius]KAB1252488.1 putative testis-expressed protein 13C [Camelus dromedarius]
MALDFGDHASGFRHNEVIRFINNEVLMNGGGPDFYVTFRSRPWNEVEDRLRVVVADSQVPRPLKRACVWSALALSVRVGARQREQEARQVQRLQDQVEEREAASWALASELQRLRAEREEAAVQLRCARVALQQVMDERDMLRVQLLQVERSAQVAPPAHDTVPVPVPPAEQLGATAWPMDAEKQGKMMTMGAQSVPQSEAQVAAPAAVLYVPGPQSPWAQAMQPPLPVPVPHPFHVPFQMGFPYSTPLLPSAVMEAEAATTATASAAAATQMLTSGIYPPGPWAAVGVQEKMAPLCDQSCYGQEEYPENLQGEYPLEDSRSHSQEEGPVCPQGMTSLGDRRSHSQEEEPEKPQGTAPLGESRSHGQNKCPVMPQEMYPSGNSKSHSKEGPERPQGTSPLRGSTSCGVRKSPKKQESQEQKAKQPKGKKASGSQHRGKKSASRFRAKNWECLSCKGMNFPWRKTCYKCKNVCVAVESESLDPGQTH